MIHAFELIDENGTLTLRRPGAEDAKDVRLRRAFPWSTPDRFISIRGSDGRELLLIEDLATIDPQIRRTIDHWMNANRFIPKIERIENVDLRFGYQEWKVQTDCGPVEFRVQEREDVHFLSDGRFRVKDADGNIYELPNLEKLDDASRKTLEGLL